MKTRITKYYGVYQPEGFLSWKGWDFEKDREIFCTPSFRKYHRAVSFAIKWQKNRDEHDKFWEETKLYKKSQKKK